MTCIVADRRAGVMAADSRYTTDGIPALCKKLERIKGRIVGVAGESAPTLALLKYFRTGEPPEDLEDLEDGYALVLCPKRGILYFDQSPEPELLDTPYFATGSGAKVALGAMFRGATAVEAVEAAIAHDVSCGGPIVSMKLQSAAHKRK